MSNLKHCEICGKTIQKPTKKELIKLVKNFVTKMIVQSINDGSFLKPLKKYGIDSENFAHHIDLIKPYVDTLNGFVKRGK